MNKLEVLIESALRIIDRASLPFWPMMSLLLPHWVTNDQFFQGAAETVEVWMCLCVVFLDWGFAISICEHALYSFKFLGGLRIVNTKIKRKLNCALLGTGISICINGT